MKKYNYGASVVLVIIALWILRQSQTLGVAAEGTAMGSGVWPSILGGAMIILAIALAVETLIKSLKQKKTPGDETPDEAPLIDFKSAGMKRIYIMMGIFLVFALLIKLFGFYISLIFLIPATMVLFGERRPKVIAIFTAGILIFVFLVFVLMLDLRLPKGSLMPW